MLRYLSATIPALARAAELDAVNNIDTSIGSAENPDEAASDRDLLVDEDSSKPALNVEKGIEFTGSGDDNHHFATYYQSANVWWDGGAEKEYFVAQVHNYDDHNLKFDDQEYIMAWAADPAPVNVQGDFEHDHLTSHRTRKLSCASVFTVVPHKGPYVYEFRSPSSRHPECSCPKGTKCPRGVRMEGHLSS